MTSYIFSTNPLARLKALGLKVAGTKAELEARYQVPSGGWRGLIEISGSMMFDWLLGWIFLILRIDLLYIYFTLAQQLWGIEGASWTAAPDIGVDQYLVIQCQKEYSMSISIQAKNPANVPDATANGSMCLKDWGSSNLPYIPYIICVISFKSVDMPQHFRWYHTCFSPKQTGWLLSFMIATHWDGWKWWSHPNLLSAFAEYSNKPSPWKP